MESSEVQVSKVAWEDRGRLGFFKALWETIKEVIFHYDTFYSKLGQKNDILNSFIFNVIVVSVSAIAAQLVVLPFIKEGPLLILVVSIVMIPLIAAAAIFIAAAIMHLFVMMFGGAGTFQDTFNVLAYSGATNIFLVIPFVGRIISIIWGIVITISGYRNVHKMSTGRAIGAVLAPMGIVFIVALMAAIAIPNLIRARNNVMQSSTYQQPEGYSVQSSEVTQ